MWETLIKIGLMQLCAHALQNMVEVECQRWASKGINIKYEIRDNRNGYKAGALKEGMKHSYVRDCDYVAIFDADFQPEPDFLWRTIPFLVNNPDVGLVQARWKFGINYHLSPPHPLSLFFSIRCYLLAFCLAALIPCFSKLHLNKYLVWRRC